MNRLLNLLTVLLFLAGWLPSLAQNDSTKRYTTARVQGSAPEIDGLINDEAWNQVEWAGGDFRQVMPDKGKPASVQTKFKILYDAKNLYVLFRCYDPDPSKIVKRMSRRDGFDGDWVEIHIDSYYDKRTAFSFTSSVSGVKGDEYVSNNGDNWDASWDPIWFLKTSIDHEGWIAEVKIPLSQLRFTDKSELTWGINVLRRYFYKQERSQWQYVPPDASGYVHRMGEMVGITGIKPQKQFEVQPYIVTQAETFEKENGNPYATGNTSGVSFGLDTKIGITSDITLDLTVNPDFGQVEADPSQVNLTAFELFFREQRPFFNEGNNTLDYPIAGMGGVNLFYSRRVGRAPQTRADTDASGPDDVDEYVKPNNRTTILGAAKLTGKNKKGFSWGIMESVTSREFAEIDSLGYKRQQITEPLTNYFVSRAQQDINKGNTIVGGIFTAMHRKLEDPRLNWLHKEAYSGGLDFLHHWKNRAYYINARGVISHVKGSAEAIAETQLSSERFFQRPDNDHTAFDPTRKSLTGTAGQLILGKRSGRLVSDLGVKWHSPEFEINDLGFMQQGDIIDQWFSMSYRIMEPKGITRSQRYGIFNWRWFDFGGKKLSEGYSANANVEFKNFWFTGMGVNYMPGRASNNDLRGGPSLKYPGNLYLWTFVNTDQRKKLSFQVNPEFGIGNEGFSREVNLDFGFVYRPTNAITISMSPSFNSNKNQMQYVATTNANGKNEYIVGAIDQTSVRVVMRMTYMITPNLSVQYYGQPFGTSGSYSNFKAITDSRARAYANRFVALSPALSLTDNEYSVDQNNDGNTDYSFGRPDFNFGQFRSNMVLRWEYIPGSTFFLVWARERNGAFYDSHPDHSNYSFDFNQKGHNIFLMKFTYRFRL